MEQRAGRGGLAGARLGGTVSDRGRDDAAAEEAEEAEEERVLDEEEDREDNMDSISPGPTRGEMISLAARRLAAPPSAGTETGESNSACALLFS